MSLPDSRAAIPDTAWGD